MISGSDRSRRPSTNIYGCCFMCEAAVPHLSEGAAIINTGSITGLERSSEPLDDTSPPTTEFGSGTPCGRRAQPEEIAPACVSFASEADSSFVTGDVRTLLGGRIPAA